MRQAASFRDPGGFLFTREGVLYRQVNTCGREDYDRLLQSGLYARLTADHLLIPHLEVNEAPEDPASAFLVIRPERVGFISYPYEWCFSQLKAAGLATLKIQKTALEYGLSLKDASAYNIQFHQGRPILIDSLSFEVYAEGKPWTAYRQFCQHFVAPLALMAYRDIRLNQLLRVYLDGVPLDLAGRLLPWRTRLMPPLLLHIHLQAAAQKRYADRALDQKTAARPVSRVGLLGLIDSLETCLRGLKLPPMRTEWGDYYASTNYTLAAQDEKATLVRAFLERIQPEVVWDLGANTGRYSRLASERGISTLAFDLDAGAVEANYLRCVADQEAHLLPLGLDLTNPSPDLGWRNHERASLHARANADAILALALIHHLAIGNNVPLAELARFFSDLGEWLIVEFIPKNDTQVQKLLETRKDIFADYTVQGFEAAFRTQYQIEQIQPLHESARVLYLMRRSGGR